MMHTTNILQHLFNKPDLSEVPLATLQEMVDKHPYFAGARYLLCKKLKEEGAGSFSGELQKTNLYFHNTLWLHFNMADRIADAPIETHYSIESIEATIENVHLVEYEEDPLEQESTAEGEVIVKETSPETEPGIIAEETSPEPGQSIIAAELLPVSESAPIETAREPAKSVFSKDELGFDPYHTIDYFASLGIRLSQDPKPDDKLGQQLKSFTAWLKTMRRLPAEVITETVEVNQADLNAHIEKIAAHSLVDKEVITQAMAEVLVMQGNRLKATEIYHKLSLLNPNKSAYFAARIEELKQN